jgi:hypothetical protein
MISKHQLNMYESTGLAIALSTVKCEVLMTVILKAQIFWNVSLCGLRDYDTTGVT